MAPEYLTHPNARRLVHQARDKVAIVVHEGYRQGDTTHVFLIAALDLLDLAMDDFSEIKEE